METIIIYRTEVFINDINIDWIRELALENVREQKGDPNIDLNHSTCFQWSITPEGQEFWYAIRNALEYNEEIDLDMLSNLFREVHQWEVFRKVVEQHEIRKSLKEFINLI